MAAGALYETCLELLEACDDAIGLAGLPPMTRQYVSPGAPPWDCPDQLTVHAGGPSQANTAPLSPPLAPGHRVQIDSAMNIVQLTVTALRCSPADSDGNPIPDVAALDVAAQQSLGDVWAIWNHLYTVKRSLALWPPKEREMFFDPAVPLPILGGICGWQIPVRVQLGGYRTAP